MEWNVLFFLNSALLGVGLAMDAFSVSLANGLNEPHMRKNKSCGIAGVFAFFQALMPTIGFLLGTSFSSYIKSYDHWIAFALLLLIGGNMIREAFKKDDGENVDASFSFKSMVVLAIATSIDALAVGVSFAALEMTALGLLQSVLIIGAVTFIISAIGIYVGNVFGSRYERGAQITGGAILIVIAAKILTEHLVNNS